jgi:hypothetical protein
MELKAGSRVASGVDATECVVIRAPKGPVELTCGGVTMSAAGDAPAGATATVPEGDGAQLGKRYVLDDIGLELLCVKAGTYPLAVGAAPLTIKSAKPLPSSD